MKIIRKYTLIIMLVIVTTSFSQKDELFPGDLNIQPFIANMLEPRLGFQFQISKNELRLDIGNSIDVYRFSINDYSILSFGADFFTYSLLRSESGFHFPVVAIDYLFGINLGYKYLLNNCEYGARLRISHISAHIVDGHFDKETGEWRNGIEPQVYSREFIELSPFYKFKNLRIYGVITFLYHVDPDILGNDSYQIGFDYFSNSILSENLHPFCGYDLKLSHLVDYEINHSLLLGLKFGKKRGKGMSLYLNYFSGKSIHGEFYFQNKNFFSLGFNIDL
ncbi:DUF1207 domain-containing protein [Bacteroidota bacterium]